MKKTFARIRGAQKRIRLFVMAGVIILSTVITAFSPALTNTANAVSPDDILNRARAWSILNAVIDQRSLVDSSISASDADTCHIFGSFDNSRVYVGAHVTGNNVGRSLGQLHDGADWSNLEENVGVATTALASVGINGGCKGLLTVMGYTFQNGSYEQPGDFGNKLSERLRNALAPNAFFGASLGNDSPGDALAYAIMIYTLKNVCGWQYRNPYSVPAPGDTSEVAIRNNQAKGNGATGNDAGQHYHTYTYEAGKAGDNTYYKEGGRTDNAYVGSHSGFVESVNDATVDCANSDATSLGARLADNHKFADAYAALVGTDAQSDGGAGSTNADGGNGQHKTTCAIDGVGWLLCPVLNTMAKIVDGAYNIVEGLLKVQPLTSTDSACIASPGKTCPSSGIYNAWQIMRNFANIAFVIVFVIIIFSQVTNVGISNYGIKKMLPRLVVAAILVNASFWVCAVFVDLSNILGASLNGLFHGVADSIQLKDKSFSGAGNGWEVITGKVIAGTAVAITALWIGLSALVPALLAALVVIVGVFLALVARQALIILLVVVSPLAFVAYLLPNTESLFKKWRELLQTLLLMYPVIALLFGMSYLASQILMAAAQ